jgi:hypothetical protein
MIVLLLVGLLTQPVAASAQSTEADVMAVITRLFDGMRAGDSAVVRSTFNPEARLMSAFEREGVPNPHYRFARAIRNPGREPPRGVG